MQSRRAAAGRSWGGFDVPVIAAPDMKAKLVAVGFDPVDSTHEQFAARLEREIADWDTIAREPGISEK